MKLSRLLRFLCIVTFVLVVAGLFTAYYGHTENEDSSLNKLYVIAFNGNRIDVDVDDRIEKSRLQIRDNFGDIIFSNGRVVGNVANEYGEVYFNFYFDDRPFAVAGHFKTNWWHTHSYRITVVPDIGQVRIKLRIEGPNMHYDPFVKYFRSKGDSILYESYTTDGQFLESWTERK